MKETYSHEFSHIQKFAKKYLGMWRINNDSIDFKWGYFAPRFGFELLLNQGGYFDQRYSIDLCLLWGKLNVKLPFKTNKEDSCEWPRYGIQIHNDTFWMHMGRPINKHGYRQDKWITWYLPFFSWGNHKLWIKNKDGKWEMEPKVTNFKWREQRQHKESHEYSYVLNSGEVQNRVATISEEKRQWNRKWFPFFKKKSHSIWIEFDDEVGEESGSWKGGCMGCGYDILPRETPVECLRRMEKERKF